MNVSKLQNRPNREKMFQKRREKSTPSIFKDYLLKKALPISFF